MRNVARKTAIVNSCCIISIYLRKDSESDYVWRKTHELEKLQNPMAPEEDLEFKLYLPI